MEMDKVERLVGSEELNLAKLLDGSIDVMSISFESSIAHDSKARVCEMAFHKTMGVGMQGVDLTSN